MEPFRLLIASHKGGVGCSTLALGLAWALGQRGFSLRLIDKNAIPSLEIIAAGTDGGCPWKGVELGEGPGQIALIDGPPLGDPRTEALLDSADAALLVARADLLGLRTLPGAAEGLCERVEAGRSRLLGLSLQCFDARSEEELVMLEGLRSANGRLLLSAPIPRDDGLMRWAERGGEPPEGAGREAFSRLAEEVAARLPVAAPEPVDRQPPALEPPPVLEGASEPESAAAPAEPGVVEAAPRRDFKVVTARRRGRSGLFRKITGLFRKA